MRKSEENEKMCVTVKSMEKKKKIYKLKRHTLFFVESSEDTIPGRCKCACQEDPVVEGRWNWPGEERKN